MRSSDKNNIASLYNKIIKENLGLGPFVNDQVSTIVGVDMPDETKNDATKMAQTEIQSIIKNAHDILTELETSDKVEPWITSKITLARDYVQTVLNYISNNA